MLFRKIESKIRDYFASNIKEVMLIEGARQIGKSYIVRHVGKSMFENYIEINFEKDKQGDRLFANVNTVEDFYIALSAIAGNKLKEKSKTLIFIDEIQAYGQFLTLVKFLKEDGRYTYIASGSLLGVALKMTSSVPVGSLLIEQMYPMDFEEFLIACGVGQEAINSFREHFNEEKSLSVPMHNKLLDLFKKYLIVGGLPEAVETFVKTLNIVSVRKIHQNVHTLYKIDAAKYEEDNSKRLQIRRIYDMIPSNLENKKKRIIFKDIENKSWKRYDDYIEEFEYLISSGIALNVQTVSQPTFPMIESAGKNLLKLYLNDVGMLSYIYYGMNIDAITKDSKSINLGSVYETVVAQELKAHGFPLFYYDNKKLGEVDFLVDDIKDLTSMPIEVKSGKDFTNHTSLDRFISNKDYNVKRAYVLSNDREVIKRNGVTYLPIYFIMFFQKTSEIISHFSPLDVDFSSHEMQ